MNDGTLGFSEDALSSVESGAKEKRIRQIVEFWNSLRVCDETGQTSWEVLEPLEREVTECLRQNDSSGIDQAESKTALAQILILGLKGL